MVINTKRFDEDYLKAIMTEKSQPKWYIESILIGYHYSEDFLREVWDYIWLSTAVQRNYHLSKDFLREKHKDLHWTDIIFYNETYSKKEKEQLIKEFNLVTDNDGDFWFEAPYKV